MLPCAIGRRENWNAAMWREYVSYAGTVIAILNGVLAFVVAMLPMRRSVAKLRLAVAALVLGVLAIGSVFYARYQGRVQAEQQQTERREIRERLETLVLEGRTLLNQIKDANRELPTRPSDEWAQRAEIFIRDKLGERFIPRFRKEVAELYGDPNIPAARLGYWRAVRNRVVNLEMIGAEFPPL
jgi:hypothetical protein